METVLRSHKGSISPALFESIKAAATPTTPAVCRCIDGRYGNDPAYAGAIARPGAHFGYVMALVGANARYELGLTPEACFEYVFDAVTYLCDRFDMHTDSATHPSCEIGCAHRPSYVPIGCGHITQALDPAHKDAYFLHNGDVAETLDIVSYKNGTIAMANLSEPHAEEAVLIVTGTKRTAKPVQDGHMFFVYDAERDRRFMESLVRTMHVPGLTPEMLIGTANLQLRSTLRILASDKPIFNVNLDGRDPIISAL